MATCPTCGHSVSDTWRVAGYVPPETPPTPELATTPGVAGVPRRRIEANTAAIVPGKVTARRG